MADRTVKKVLVGIVASFLMLCLAFNLATPAYEGFDESSHVAYTQHVRKTWSIPVLPSPIFEAIQPPAYYFIQATLGAALGLGDTPVAVPRDRSDGPLALYHHEDAERTSIWSGPIGALRTMRVMSSVIGAVTLLVAFALLRAVVPGRPEIALSAVATMAFIPQFVFIHSLSSNDSLALLWAAVVLLGSVRLIRAKERRTLLVWAAITGAGVGLGLITKDFMLAFVPIPVVALAISPLNASLRVTAGGVVLGAVLVTSGWMYVRNVALYGAVLPFEAAREHNVRILPETVVPRTITDPAFRGEFLREVRDTFWYSGGGGQVRAPQGIYLGLDLLTAVGAIGAVGAMVDRRRLGLAASARGALGFLVMAPILCLAGIVFYNLTYQQWQGRWMFPSLPVLALFYVLGVAFLWPPRWRGVAWIALPLAILGLCVYVLVGVHIPAFHG